MNEQAPFVLQHYDKLNNEYFDIWPVENHIFNNLDDAYLGAHRKLNDLQTAPSDDMVGIQQDAVYIVDVNGKRIQYP